MPDFAVAVMIYVTPTAHSVEWMWLPGQRMPAARGDPVRLGKGRERTEVHHVETRELDPDLLIYTLGPRGRRREFANATWIDRVWRDGCWDLEGDSCIEGWLKGD